MEGTILKSSKNTHNAKSYPKPAKPMPDQSIRIADRNAYGYTYKDMLPLNKDCAIDLYNKNYAVFLLYSDGTESSVCNLSEITGHDGIFGIEREDWYKKPFH